MSKTQENDLGLLPMTERERGQLHREMTAATENKIFSFLQGPENKGKPRSAIIAEVAGMLQIDPDFRVLTGQLFSELPQADGQAPVDVTQQHIKPGVANALDTLAHRQLISPNAGGYEITQTGQQEARRRLSVSQNRDGRS